LPLGSINRLCGNPLCEELEDILEDDELELELILELELEKEDDELENEELENDELENDELLKLLEQELESAGALPNSIFLT
jgi:hypothetical protein